MQTFVVLSGAADPPNGMVSVGKMNEGDSGVEIYVARFKDYNNNGEENYAYGYYYPAGGLHTEGGYYEFGNQGNYADTMELLVVF